VTSFNYFQRTDAFIKVQLYAIKQLDSDRLKFIECVCYFLYLLAFVWGLPMQDYFTGHMPFLSLNQQCKRLCNDILLRYWIQHKSIQYL